MPETAPRALIMPSYELTREAEADLEEMAEYTLGEWGAEQQARYAALLEAGFAYIADDSAIPRRFSEHYPHVLVIRCGYHYVFYLKPEGAAVPRIIAVLHERMDIVARLRDRLEGFSSP
jgi:plasmid stabilization system protein ParE